MQEYTGNTLVDDTSADSSPVTECVECCHKDSHPVTPENFAAVRLTVYCDECPEFQTCKL
jgi:hypothetical protein